MRNSDTRGIWRTYLSGTERASSVQVRLSLGLLARGPHSRARALTAVYRPRHCLLPPSLLRSAVAAPLRHGRAEFQEEFLSRVDAGSRRPCQGRHPRRRRQRLWRRPGRSTATRQWCARAEPTSVIAGKDKCAAAGPGPFERSRPLFLFLTRLRLSPSVRRVFCLLMHSLFARVFLWLVFMNRTQPNPTEPNRTQPADERARNVCQVFARERERERERWNSESSWLVGDEPTTLVIGSTSRAPGCGRCCILSLAGEAMAPTHPLSPPSCSHRANKRAVEKRILLKSTSFTFPARVSIDPTPCYRVCHRYPTRRRFFLLMKLTQLTQFFDAPVFELEGENH